MLPKLLPVGVSITEGPLFQRSRCLRMRHRGNGCARCLEACPRQALNFAKDPVVDAAACNSCYQCTAACPTDALMVRDFDFNRYLREIGPGSALVIGCTASRVGMRLAIPCLGLLSDTHLTVLGLLRKNVAIDLAPCRKCTRAPVAQTVQNRLERLRSLLLPETITGIRLQLEAESLPPASRRDFFAALKSTVIRQVTTAIQNDARSPAAYADKTLPFKRRLLNEALRSATAEERKEAAKAFYFSPAVNEACNLCFTCVAACPAGALRKKKETESKSLQFQSASCSGCGLCMDFCRRKAILLQPAESAAELFTWRTLAINNQIA
jgi:ferredoxin